MSISEGFIKDHFKKHGSKAIDNLPDGIGYIFNWDLSDMLEYIKKNNYAWDIQTIFYKEGDYRLSIWKRDVGLVETKVIIGNHLDDMVAKGLLWTRGQ